MLQFSAFCIIIPTFEVKGQYSWFLIFFIKIVVMCFNNRQPYVHVRFHDQFVTWYQNSYMLCAVFFFWGGGGYRLARVGFYGAVNVGHDEDLELWL